MAGATRPKESHGCVIGSKITQSELAQIQDLDNGASATYIFFTQPNPAQIIRFLAK
jgi:hypothetical protein